MYQQFEFNITREEQKDKASRCIMHFSYDCAPEQLYDQNLLNQARSTMSQSQFDREFNADKVLPEMFDYILKTGKDVNKFSDDRSLLTHLFKCERSFVD